MKSILYLFSFVGMFSISESSIAQESAQISLTITYEGKALCDWDITVKHGDVVLAKGITDKSGYVKFDQTTIIAKDVDVYGYKKTANGEKKWDMKGYVKLDDNYYAHIKMETVVDEAVKGSGLPKSMLLDAWGLTSLNCDGSVTTPVKEENSTTSNNTGSHDDATEEPMDPNMGLKQQKTGYENQINSLDKRISKKETALAENRSKGILSPMDEKIEQLEIDELKIKKEERTVGLERINKSIDNKISESEKSDYLKKEKDLREQARAKDDERRDLLKQKKDAERDAKNNGDQSSAGEKMDKAGLKMKIKFYQSEINTQTKAAERLREKGKIEEAEKKEKNVEEYKVKLAEAEAKLAAMQ